MQAYVNIKTLKYQKTKQFPTNKFLNSRKIVRIKKKYL